MDAYFDELNLTLKKWYFEYHFYSVKYFGKYFE